MAAGKMDQPGPKSGDSLGTPVTLVLEGFVPKGMEVLEQHPAWLNAGEAAKLRQGEEVPRHGPEPKPHCRVQSPQWGKQSPLQLCLCVHRAHPSPAPLPCPGSCFRSRWGFSGYGALLGAVPTPKQHLGSTLGTCFCPHIFSCVAWGGGGAPAGAPEPPPANLPSITRLPACPRVPGRVRGCCQQPFPAAGPAQCSGRLGLALRRGEHCATAPA